MTFLLSLLFMTSSSLAVDLDFHGYLRAGAGTNGKGAKQECFSNGGIPGNPMRLGNECGIYGETALGAKFLKGNDTEPFFYSQVRFAYFPPGNTSYEDDDADGRDINVVEAFAEGGRLDGSPLTYWVGKRFYRDIDLHIFDWYYFAEMNGNGAGIGNIPMGSGKLALAFLLQTGSTRTNIGLNQNQVLDVRWQNIDLGEKDKLHFWGAFGEAPAGRSGANTFFVKRNGWLAGIRWMHSLNGGFNDVAIVHGQNLLEGMNLYGDASQQFSNTSPAPTARRWRFVENFSKQLSSRWGIQGGAGMEIFNPNSASTDSRGSWWAAGVRPVYFFSDHHQIAFEMGHIDIQDKSEKESDGRLTGHRTLTRFTLAPQISVGPGLWARPVLRAFYTRSYWNGANRSRMASSSPAFAGSLHGEALGFQTEVWF